MSRGAQSNARARQRTPRVDAPSTHSGSDAAEEMVTACFDEFRLPLLRYLASLGITVHDSEEVAQEVFVALYQHLSRGRPQTNLRGWVFRVAHNLGLRRLASNHRHLRLVTREAIPPAAPALDPETRITLDQQREQMLAVFRSLPETDRRCLSLRAEGLRYREIARVLGISLGSVALSLKRSLTALGKKDEE